MYGATGQTASYTYTNGEDGICSNQAAFDSSFALRSLRRELAVIMPSCQMPCAFWLAPMRSSTIKPCIVGPRQLIGGPSSGKGGVRRFPHPEPTMLASDREHEGAGQENVLNEILTDGRNTGGRSKRSVQF